MKSLIFNCSKIACLEFCLHSGFQQKRDTETEMGLELDRFISIRWIGLLVVEGGPALDTSGVVDFDTKLIGGVGFVLKPIVVWGKQMDGSIQIKPQPIFGSSEQKYPSGGFAGSHGGGSHSVC